MTYRLPKDLADAIDRIIHSPINLRAPRPGEYADRLKLVERPRKPRKARKENK
jgi:hypothetical protein